MFLVPALRASCESLPKTRAVQKINLAQLQGENMNSVTNEVMVSALSIFFVLFSLKIAGYIYWSWLVVTMPLWLPLCVLLLSVIAAAFLFVASTAYDRITK